MTTRTRKATQPANKNAEQGNKAPAKATRRRPAKKTAARQPLPVRTGRPYMTDIQGYATLAARIAGITTPRITAWVDHSNGTATRALRDGTLHYTHKTRTLTWQATCLMGAVHTYEISSPATASAARVLAARCNQKHADLSTVQALTADELAALGLHTGPTWARPDLLGDDITETIPVPLPDRQPRALADELTHSNNGPADTQPLPAAQIAAVLAPRADNETLKEHPQP